jgi:hypothetical protein
VVCPVRSILIMRAIGNLLDELPPEHTPRRDADV